MIYTKEAIQYVYDNLPSFAKIAQKKGINIGVGEDMVFKVVDTILHKKRTFENVVKLNNYIIIAMRRIMAKHFQDEYVNDLTKEDLFAQMNLAREIINSNRLI